MSEYLIIFLIILFASGVHGFVGFGYGLILMAILPFIIPVTTATIIVSFSSMFFSLYMVWRNRAYIDTKLVLFPLIGILLFIPAGVFLLNYVDDQILKPILGLVLISISLFSLVRKEENFSIKSTPFNGILTGSISGILNGWLSVGGPPLVLYFVQSTPDKYSYKVAMDLVFLINSIYRLIWLFIYGNLTATMLPLLSLTVVGGIAGTIIGYSFLVKTDKSIINKVVYLTLVVAGAMLIIF